MALSPVEGETIATRRYGLPAEFREFMNDLRECSPGRGTAVARSFSKVSTIHIADVLADPEYTLHSEAQKLGDFRTLLGCRFCAKACLSA